MNHWTWTGFLLFILAMLLIDLKILHRKAHTVNLKEALGYSAMWIALTALFGVALYFAGEAHWVEFPDNGAAVMQFTTSYILEKSLSVDNLFVIALVFSALAIPEHHQHRVLFWGIVGALCLRGSLIILGSTLIERAQWLLYGFGGFLLFTACKGLLSKEELDPQNSALLRAARRYLPVTDKPVGQRFITRVNGKLMLTPLGLALLAVEGTDLIFAMDSIPAVFTITTDPLLVFTSNVFAMLGLRWLYFVVAGFTKKFHYLKISLSLILSVVGLKMILKDVLHQVPQQGVYTLGLIALILASGIIASLLHPRQGGAQQVPAPPRSLLLIDLSHRLNPWPQAAPFALLPPHLEPPPGWLASLKPSYRIHFKFFP